MAIPTAPQITTLLEEYTSKANGLPSIINSKLFELFLIRNEIGFRVVRRDGSVLYEGYKGKEPLSSDATYGIASATKLFTAIGTLQLVEQAKIHLDDPIEKYVPEFASFKILEGFDKDDNPIFNDPKTKATLRQTLTHTAGTSNHMFNPMFAKYIQKFNVPTIMARKREGINTPLAFEPGTKWEYGNGIDWTGVTIEKVSGLKLGQYFQQHIFGPLGLQSTSFDSATGISWFNRGPDGELKETKIPPRQAEYHSGGGGLISTVPDYTAVLQALLNDGVGANGNRILNKETVEELFKDQTSSMFGGLLKEPTLNSNMVVPGELYPGIEKSWSFAGLRLEQGTKTGRPAGSITWAGIANTHWYGRVYLSLVAKLSGRWVDRTKGIAGVFFTQVLPFFDPEVVECWTKCEQKIYEAL